MSLINIDEWASDNNIDTPKRLVNNGTWGINDYTQVFQDIFENNPSNVTIELTAGKKYGYSKTLAHGNGSSGRFTITSDTPSSHYGPRPMMVAIPNANGKFGNGMKNISIPGNSSLGMPAFDEDSNGGRVPKLPKGVTAGIWSATGNVTISNVSFATASEVRETKPHVYLWMVRYANSGS